MLRLAPQDPDPRLFPPRKLACHEYRTDLCGPCVIGKSGRCLMVPRVAGDRSPRLVLVPGGRT